jgi:prophage regulatory protein
MKASLLGPPQQASFELNTLELPSDSPLGCLATTPVKRKKKQRAQPEWGDVPLRLLRRAAVERKTGLSRSSIYRFMSDPGGDFPSPVHLSTNVVAWIESEIDEWISRRITASRSGARK